MIYFYDDWFAYFEVDETTNTALRQIEIKSTGEIVVSNRKHPRYHYGLTDTEMYFRKNSCTKITNTEFEDLWRKGNEANITTWHDIKSAFPIGTVLEGQIEVIYPQGTIIRASNNEEAIALADYWLCKN